MTSAVVTQPTGGIPAPVRRAIARMVLDLRGALQEDFGIQLRALGIAASGVGPVPGGRVLPPADVRARDLAVAVIERERAAGATPAEALGRYVRESAFTFLNRLVGLRCLEARGLLLVDGLTETVVTIDPARNASSLYARVRSEQRAAPPRELWRETLRRACTAVSEQVQVLFDPDSEYAALLPQQAILQQALDVLNDTAAIPASTWAQDEMLGWVYQYFNVEEEARIRATKKKYTGEDIIPVSQRYTERYMVDYLLQNTLGTLWTELHPDTQLRSGWLYFVSPPSGNQSVVRAPRRLRDITLLDPCCGSGHFLLSAFDLLVEMYAEEGLERASDVPGLILERNLYGIDIDLRAVQIAALGLFMKARTLDGSVFRPNRLNLVVADANLPSQMPAAQYMRRFREDREISLLIGNLWSGLRNVREFGSLLHPGRPIDEVIERRKQTHQLEFGQLAPDSSQWEYYRRELLEGLREEFERQAESEDLGQRLFGQEAKKGVSLVESLDKRYDIVITNPPYIGSGNMGEKQKEFIDREYKDAKSDVYAAFILRCRDFCHSESYLGMVTQQTWLYQSSLSNLRQDLVRNTTINSVAHLGPRAFTDIKGEIVNVCLFTLSNNPAPPDHRMVAYRILAPRTPEEKGALLRSAIATNAGGIHFVSVQNSFLNIPGQTIAYSAHPFLLTLFPKLQPLSWYSPARDGISTTDNAQFLRNTWEVVAGNSQWRPYVKGGSTQRWFGLNHWCILWGNDGKQLKDYVRHIKGHSHWSRQIRSAEQQFCVSGLTYSLMGSGKLGVRLLVRGTGWDTASLAIIPKQHFLSGLLAYLNSRIASMLARILSPELKFRGGYVSQLPVLSPEALQEGGVLSELGKLSLALAENRDKQNPIERFFEDTPTLGSIVSMSGIDTQEKSGALIATIEACVESQVGNFLGLSHNELSEVLAEIGKPCGWNPLIIGYDALPPLPTGVPEAPIVLLDFLAKQDRVNYSIDEIRILKRKLRDLYSSRSGQKEATFAEGISGSPDEPEEGPETGAVVGTPIPLSPETTIEGLSERLSTHPISIYWLLKEMHEQEKLASVPEMKRQLEDWTSVALLRMLGHRWPEQDNYERERGALLDPALVDEDGIVPLVRCQHGQPIASERVRTYVERHFQPDDVDIAEHTFRAYVGRDIVAWLRSTFFERHIQQFEQRPIVWHLISPERTFEAFILYHRLSRETLQKLRTQYAGGLIERLRAEQEQARGRGDTERVGELRSKIEDVEEFRHRLERIERGDELNYRIRCPWKGEEKTGRPGPYAPDIDDGVKVNIRPFQEAGLLAMKDVIKKW